MGTGLYPSSLCGEEGAPEVATNANHASADVAKPAGLLQPSRKEDQTLELQGPHHLSLPSIATGLLETLRIPGFP